MIEIYDNTGGEKLSAGILRVRDDDELEHKSEYASCNRGRKSDFYHTRDEDGKRIMTVKLFDELDPSVGDHGRDYKEINLSAVELSSDGEWSEDWVGDVHREFAIWLPDREIWVGITRSASYGIRPSLRYSGPFRLIPSMAAGIYEAFNGEPFIEAMQKIDPKEK